MTHLQLLKHLPQCLIQGPLKHLPCVFTLDSFLIINFQLTQVLWFATPPVFDFHSVNTSLGRHDRVNGGGLLAALGILHGSC